MSFRLSLIFASKAGAFQLLHSRVGSWPQQTFEDWDGKALPGTNTIA